MNTINPCKQCIVLSMCKNRYKVMFRKNILFGGVIVFSLDLPCEYLQSYLLDKSVTRDIREKRTEHTRLLFGL